MAKRTPFGEELARLRAERGMQLKDLAARLNVTPAYLSALETGQRGVPNRRLQHQICQVFAIIWDEADALADLAANSNPQPQIDVRGCGAGHVHLANALARQVPMLADDQVAALLKSLKEISEPAN